MSAAYEVLPSFEVESDAWHEQREKSIGASDVAAVLHLSPWQTPLDIYNAKKGVRKDIDPDLAYFGHALEGVIAQWVLDHHMAEMHSWAMGYSARSSAWPWLTAAPDRMASSVEHDTWVPVEIKTARNSWPDGPPIHYVAQVQQQLAVFGAPYGWLAVLHGGNTPDLHRIERDDDFIDNVLVPETRKFWFKHVLVDTPPKPTTTAEAVSLWPGDAALDALEADDDLYDLWQNLMAARREKDQSTNDAEKYALEIQKAMGDATELRYEGRVLATWKPQAGARRLDTALLKKEHPDLAAEYTRAGEATRRFLPKEPKAVNA